MITFHSLLVLVGILVFLTFLAYLSWVDLTTGYLPDRFTLALLWLGLLFNLDGLFVPLDHAVLGAALGYGGLWIANRAFRHVAGCDGMGYGDFKMTAAIGAWVGASMLPWLILGACIAGIGSHWAHRRSAASATAVYPFGPALAGSGVFCLLALFSG